MGISLEEPREVTPAIRLPEIGDFVTGHIVHMEMRDDIDPDTKQARLNEAGKPKKVQVLTIFVTAASPGAKIGIGDELRTPEEGDEGRIFVQGGTWKWWIEAKKMVARLEVGDVIRWKFESESPNPNKRHSNFKDRKFAIRKPNDSEVENVRLCEARHKEIMAQATQPDRIELSDEIDF